MNFTRPFDFVFLCRDSARQTSSKLGVKIEIQSSYGREIQQIYTNRTEGVASAEPSLLGLCRVMTEEDKSQQIKVVTDKMKDFG